LEHVLHHKITSLAVFKKGVFQQLISRGPSGRILVQTRSHHVPERLRELVPVPLSVLIQIGETKAFRDLQHHGLGRWKVRERRPSMRQLQCGYPKGPYVSLQTVPRVRVNHLRSHPIRRAGDVSELQRGARGGLVDRRRHAEIRQLHLSVCVNEDVPGFYVAVEVALAVEVGEGVEGVSENHRDAGFG